MEIQYVLRDVMSEEVELINRVAKALDGADIEYEIDKIDHERNKYGAKLNNLLITIEANKYE